jgi:hypothetical protein
MSTAKTLFLSLEAASRLQAEAQAGYLKPDSYPVLVELLESLITLLSCLAEQKISQQRLQRLLFGPKTEKKKGTGKPTQDASSKPSSEPDPASEPTPTQGESRAGQGHGRLPADAYEAAQICPCAHAHLQAGQRCPQCGRGILRLQKPSIEIRITGHAPLGATRYELERLRCDTCGWVVTARPPPEAPAAKYSPSAVSMIGVLKYGTGMPFFRLARLQQRLGVPLPWSTQYELVRDASQSLQPVVDQLWQLAAQADLVFVDDSPMPILQAEKKDRKATRTTVIVARHAAHWIYLYETSFRHAGDNLERLFSRRPAHLPAPIQMSDALAANAAHPIATLITHCLVHARRYFFDIQNYYPEICEPLLEKVALIFQAEKQWQQRDPLERLALHRDHSLPRLEQIRDTLASQLEARLIEPNSSLGKAAHYFLDHFDELTGFCRIPGAPLDNNISERALKMPILNRKNAYFFKTDRGAQVGDVWMSLIQTAAFARINPFDYLTFLQENTAAAAVAPEDFLPWTARAAA